MLRLMTNRQARTYLRTLMEVRSAGSLWRVVVAGAPMRQWPYRDEDVGGDSFLSIRTAMRARRRAARRLWRDALIQARHWTRTRSDD